MSKVYCVYAFLDENKSPYYLGQTSNFKIRRVKHMSEINKEKPIYYQHRKAKKLIQKGHNFLMVKLVDNLSKRSADFYEKVFIATLRGCGVRLGNSQDGGSLHFEHSLEARSKISRNNARHWLSNKKTEAHISKMRSTKIEFYKSNPGPRLGYKASDETKRKLSISHKGIKWKTEHKEKLKLIRNKIKPSNTRVWRVSSPDKKVYLCWGLGSFCRTFNLSQSKMQLVAQGKSPHHKNWGCTYFLETLSDNNLKIIKDSGYIVISGGL